MSYITMYDAVTVQNIPRDAVAVAGYVDGEYPNLEALKGRFPNAKHVTVSVNSAGNADFLDVEKGDAVIADTPAWLHRQILNGVWRPGVYANVDYWYRGGMYNLLRPFGDKIRRWAANWTGREEIPNGFDACQFSGGQVLDISACHPEFFAPKAAIDPYHYDWFDNERVKIKYGHVVERKVVERYDVERKHPLRHYIALKHDLQPCLVELAQRLEYEAWHDETGKRREKPEWDRYRRGWRHVQLLDRAQGKMVVK